ncbi:MAG: DUF2541 family protein [Saprospiraceae bacterium]|nr:DUF2541 family protein [Saprospiraceae bacterium]
MKKSGIFNPLLLLSLFVVSLFGISATLPSDTSLDLPPRWELLGSKKVNFGLDRDEIPVTIAEGTFTALKIKVRRSGINMHRMVVHYGNGGTQEIDIRKNIPQGGETRVIDINGGARVIKKVVFWYDTKNIRARKGVIELWGRK